MLWNTAKRRPKLTYLHEKCPLSHCPDNKTVETVDGHLCRVIELDGVDYTGMTAEIIDGLFAARLDFFEKIGQGLVPTIFTHRYKLSKELNLDDHGNEISNRIAHDWAKTFSSTYRNRHFISLRTIAAGALEQVAGNLKGEGESLGARRRRLDNIELDIIHRLSRFEPHVLDGDSLASFWSTLLNGETQHIKMPANGNFDEILTSADIFWPSDKPELQIYEGSSKRFSTWVTLRAYEDEDEGIESGLFNELFQLNREFILAQSFDLQSKEKALKRVKALRNRMKGWEEDDSAALKIKQLDELAQNLESDNEKLCHFRFALQLFADSEEELRESVAEVQSVISRYRFQSRRERLLSEALFWSMFPGYEIKMNPRNREVTSKNLSCHITFSSVGEGQNHCSWGDVPVIPFRTESGSEYSFCFHDGTGSKVLGHTLIVGGAGAGKTTLMQILATHCRKYPGMRQIFLDQLRGLKNGILLQGGDYLSFDAIPQINPLQQDDTPANRQFLARWLQGLSGSSDNKAVEIINDTVQKNFELNKRDRNLNNLKIMFGLQEEDSFLDNMARWLPGGMYEAFFNGERDSLQFGQSSMLGIDMTRINKNSEVLGPIAEYMYHRIETMAEETPGPFVLWTDEYRNHIQNPILGPLQVNAKQQYRKLDGVCVDAVQSPEHITGTIDSPNKWGIETLEQYATFIFFPSPSADFEILKEHFNINKEEYDWIRNPINLAARKVLVKRKSGTSTVLDVNLSALGGLLNCYSSDADKAFRLSALMKEYPSTWRERYLAEFS